jgi:hypothetical protein
MCLLLLPGPLEGSFFADRAEDLRRARGVVAVEPARIGAGRGGDRIAMTQARRLAKQLPGVPRVVVVFEPLQYRLARAVIARHEGCELWYAPGGATYADGVAAELDARARERSVFGFDPSPPGPGEAAFQVNAPLWERLEQLRIARR